MLVKGIEPWYPWFHTNILAIKSPHHFVKQYDINGFNMYFWISIKKIVNVYNNIWTLILFISRLVGTQLGG
jgi:hypothetical protein